mmetsp:Transcript_137568/g.343283  ORF Transcript_137568/g.343283 Transcript_137568/m.343283 type:complete len:185 (+) Transcript_137568:85-639(+)|eukprot:CAMPEP_0115224396 /NCGR_PEP_ID=MMETSP0270-20121206/29551_1 /TAXON_ID=71861 /ORGANISM="Scrippsiella trochoidea, Strain CCMP3099" /LENGTH=184 /DNA_ID=CAMNT_0002638701 /DNA_START=48 /DNA_END=602 /DNA_ORIENTATION=-
MAGDGEVKQPRWDGNEFVAIGAAGNEIRLPYELYDHCGFRATEIREFAWAFRISDYLEDGYISTSEVLRAVERLGETPTQKDFVRVMNEVDPHAVGKHNFSQFVKIMSTFDRSLLTEDELINAFKVFDKDQSGSIDAIEMQALMKALNINITALEAHGIIDQADDDKSGEVTFNEFVGKVLDSQ